MIGGLVPLGGIVMGAVKTPPVPCGSTDDDVEDASLNELELLRELDDVFIGKPVLLEDDFADELGVLLELDDTWVDDPAPPEDVEDEMGSEASVD